MFFISPLFTLAEVNPKDGSNVLFANKSVLYLLYTSKEPFKRAKSEKSTPTFKEEVFSQRNILLGGDTISVTSEFVHMDDI